MLPSRFTAASSCMFTCRPCVIMLVLVMLSCSWLATMGRCSAIFLKAGLAVLGDAGDTVAAVQAVKGGGNLLRLNQRIRPVQQQHVQVVGLQAL